MFPAIQKAESLENISKNFSLVFKDLPYDFGQMDRDIINKSFGCLQLTHLSPKLISHSTETIMQLLPEVSQFVKNKYT